MHLPLNAASDHMSFEKDSCHFILHKSDHKFAESFILKVNVDNVKEFWKMVNEEIQKFGICATARADALWKRDQIY
jgi:hypothetical protein